MLYLEDYLEMIENLPMEMRDRFTEMREMDLQVQNAMDSLEDRVKKFFEKCSNTPTLKVDWKDDHFKKIKEDYHRALEDADEKVQLTAQIYDQLERYLRKLDTELQKFKLELEADNAGITEVLEKRSLELDNPQNNHSMNHRGEKRKYSQMMSNHVDKRRPDQHSDKMFSSLASEAARESHHHIGSSVVGGSGVGAGSSTASSHHRGLVSGGGGGSSTTNSPAGNMFNSTSTATASASSSSSATPALSYSLGHVGAGSNAAIAAAASRAIGATLEMSQGRRTASLKASYEAMRNAEITKELTISRQYSSASGGGGGGGGGSESTTPTPTPTTTTQKSRNKKSSSRAQQQQQQQAAAAAAAQSQLAQQLQQQVAVENTPPPTELVADTVVGEEQTTASTWQVDPNEPRYCICNDVSYGDMVGCDNDDCPIEWFHYGCVGLTAAPRGKWYCPQCTVAMKRRGRK